MFQSMKSWIREAKAGLCWAAKGLRTCSRRWSRMAGDQVFGDNGRGWVVIQFLGFVIIVWGCVLATWLFNGALEASARVTDAWELTGISFANVKGPDASHQERGRWFASAVFYNLLTIVVVAIKIWYRQKNNRGLPADIGIAGFLFLAFAVSCVALWGGLTFGEGWIITVSFAIIATIYVVSDWFGLIGAQRAISTAKAKNKNERRGAERALDGYRRSLALDIPNALFYIFAVVLVMKTELGDHEDFVAGLAAGGFLLVNFAFVALPMFEGRSDA